MDFILKILEYIGTVAFAVSGAVKATNKRMDLFGVIMSAVVTATGGGLIRDIVLGIAPPAVFYNIKGVVISVVTALLVFCAQQVFKKHAMINSIAKFVLIADTAGLAAFTVTGSAVAMEQGYQYMYFLVVFCGAVTGAGGGLLRDIMVREVPEIFVRNIYVCASALAALVFVFLCEYESYTIATVASVIVTCSVRWAAVRYDLNLPASKGNWRKF